MTVFTMLCAGWGSWLVFSAAVTWLCLYDVCHDCVYDAVCWLGVFARVFGGCDMTVFTTVVMTVLVVP